MLLRICTFGEPILRAKGEQVRHFDADLRRLSEDMIETMYANNGIGLAAQQIGRQLQLCVVDIAVMSEEEPSHYHYDGKTPPMESFMPLVLINPVVQLVPEPQGEYNEGCLSFPGIVGEVSRPLSIQVAFQDLDGQSHDLSCDGMLARVIQHEVDHLNGILFIDRMDRRLVKKLESKVKKIQRQSRSQMKGKA